MELTQAIEAYEMKRRHVVEMHQLIMSSVAHKEDILQHQHRELLKLEQEYTASVNAIVSQR